MWLTAAPGPGPNRLSEKDEQAECRDWATMRMAVGIVGIFGIDGQEDVGKRVDVCQASHRVGEYDNGRWGRKAKMTSGRA